MLDIVPSTPDDALQLEHSHVQHSQVIKLVQKDNPLSAAKVESLSSDHYFQEFYQQSSTEEAVQDTTSVSLKQIKTYYIIM